MTPGHTAYLVASRTEQLMIWGDTVHVPEVQTAIPEAGMAFDTDLAAAAEEALFEAVFDQEVDRAARNETDALMAMAKGTQAYFDACAKDTTGQIVLHDGPAVLGWERWREIDNSHFGGRFPVALARYGRWA